MTIDIVHASTWGSGHGATRHLVDHGTYAVSPELGPRSRCAGGRYRLELLEAVATGLNNTKKDSTVCVRDIVRAKKPCRSCASFAHRFGVNAEEALLPFSRSDERRAAIVERLSGPAAAQSVHALCDWLRAHGHQGGWEMVDHDLYILTGQGRVKRESVRFGARWQAVTNPVGKHEDQAAQGATADTVHTLRTAVPSMGETS